MEDLKAQISNLSTQIDYLPEKQALNTIRGQIKEKERERDSLGFFKGKEKKAIQAHISELVSKETDAQRAFDSAASSYLKSISKMKDRITEIEKELEKDI